MSLSSKSFKRKGCCFRLLNSPLKLLFGIYATTLNPELNCFVIRVKEEERSDWVVRIFRGINWPQESNFVRGGVRKRKRNNDSQWAQTAVANNLSRNTGKLLVIEQLQISSLNQIQKDSTAWKFYSGIRINPEFCLVIWKIQGVW